MQTEKGFRKSPADGYEGISLGESAHFICISSESGITAAFEQIKAALRGEANQCLTLVYSTPADPTQPLFKAELESLEKRFPSRLITHYVSSQHLHAADNSASHQRILEIIINSNTFGRMQFQVLGQEDFAGMIIDRLQFLGIPTNQIISQIIY